MLAIPSEEEIKAAWEYVYPISVNIDKCMFPILREIGKCKCPYCQLTESEDEDVK